MKLRIEVGAGVPAAAYESLVNVLRARLDRWQIVHERVSGPELPATVHSADEEPPAPRRLVLFTPEHDGADRAARELALPLAEWSLAVPPRFHLTVIAPDGSRLTVAGQEGTAFREQLVALLFGSSHDPTVTPLNAAEPYEPEPTADAVPPPYLDEDPTGTVRSEPAGTSYTGRPPGPPFDDDDDEW